MVESSCLFSVALIEIANARGEKRPPHATTVYRWRQKYLQARRDVRAIFCDYGSQGGKGVSRLQPEVEALIHEKIESEFLKNRRGTAEDVHNAVFLKIQQLNTTRIESEWLEVPGLRTIQRRLEKLYAFEVATARFGLREAMRRFANFLGARRVSRILELVEIDHTPVDMLVVDERRVYIGRPTLTVCIDRYSRCCLGYHLSLAGHGTPAVFSALAHSLLPKCWR